MGAWRVKPSGARSHFVGPFEMGNSSPRRIAIGRIQSTGCTTCPGRSLH
jgi:hypothetical protein